MQRVRPEARHRNYFQTAEQILCRLDKGEITTLPSASGKGTKGWDAGDQSPTKRKEKVNIHRKSRLPYKVQHRLPGKAGQHLLPENYNEEKTMRVGRQCTNGGRLEWEDGFFKVLLSERYNLWDDGTSCLETGQRDIPRGFTGGKE